MNSAAVFFSPAHHNLNNQQLKHKTLFIKMIKTITSTS
ncbi:hypothetical protein [uncultured Gammaproteobacteria bacterium]|nr:hypothetical protein [uncultured Gammaproteobacteria bacterium]CAC9950623.1 hypothetical protein [uncultured Gammaproteobacteria bacterium]CAC9955942.1 hypothetical protein [uncultured Gammaproteobacteria bacterium]